MELFNFVLLLIVQVTVAQYALPPQMYDDPSTKPSRRPNNAYNLPPSAPQNVYNPQNDYNEQTYPSSPNGLNMFNGYLPSGSQYIGQPQLQNNYNIQGGMSPMPDQILQQHLMDWRTLQTIANNFFDSVARFAESFISTPTIFGGTTQNSLFNPSNLNALNEIYVSLKFMALGLIKIVKNVLGSSKYLIQFYGSNGNINIQNVIVNLLKGFVRFWMFR